MLHLKKIPTKHFVLVSKIPFKLYHFYYKIKISFYETEENKSLWVTDIKKNPPTQVCDFLVSSQKKFYH